MSKPTELKLGIKDWIWFADANVYHWQNETEPKLYPQNFSKFVRESAVVERITELETELTDIKESMPFTARILRERREKITELETKNIRLVEMLQIAEKELFRFNRTAPISITNVEKPVYLIVRELLETFNARVGKGG